MKQSCWTSRSFPVRARQIRVDPERSDHLSCNRFFWKRALLHESMAQTSHKEPFPSPKGGGPIEAHIRSWRSESLRSSPFPSPKGGGPIEARQSDGADGPIEASKALVPAGQFPSPKGGGPIEASTGVNSVLPMAFPSPKGGGPIEAYGTPGSPCACLSRFHRRKAVAPLKPALLASSSLISREVSIAERRWPH